MRSATWSFRRFSPLAACKSDASLLSHAKCGSDIGKRPRVQEHFWIYAKSPSHSSRIITGKSACGRGVPAVDEPLAVMLQSADSLFYPVSRASLGAQWEVRQERSRQAITATSHLELIPASGPDHWSWGRVMAYSSVLAADSGQTEKEIQTMTYLKKLTLGGLTVAALAMAASQPAKADPITTAITAATDAINLVVYNYGTIKWTYTQ